MKTSRRFRIGCFLILAFVGACVIAGGIFTPLMLARSRAAFTRTTDHLAAHAPDLPTAVQSLISAASRASSSTQHASTSTASDPVASSQFKILPRGIVEREDLPSALAAPDVKFAIISSDHISLIIHTSPDVISGFRLWLNGQSAGYRDEPTSLRNVYRFTYCNDYSTSPSNQPE